MTEHETIERRTVVHDAVTPHETIERTEIAGTPDDGDEEAGGALVGGLGGALVGAVVGGPVGAVVGGAIGAAAGATAGLADEASDDDEIVVEREERRG